MDLVLSLFPGIGMLDRAFEEEMLTACEDCARQVLSASEDGSQGT